MSDEEANSESNENNAPTEVLDQGDIDFLLQQAVEKQTGAVYSSDGTRFDSPDKVSISLFDFRSPSYLKEAEIRQLRIKHEAFSRYLASRLSLFMRMDFKLTFEKLQTLPYEKYVETRSTPTAISVFNIDKLNGVGILDINPRLAMTIVNRMLGGKGHSVGDERALTEIEVGLMEEIVGIILDEWSQIWKGYDDLQPSIVGRENDAKFLQAAPRDAVMLIVSLKGELGDCSSSLSLAMPFYMIEPIVRSIQASNNRFTKENDGIRSAKWTDTYSDIKVPLCAQWDASEMSMREVLSLRKGDVIELSKELMKKTQIRIMNTPCFSGEVGVNGGQVGVKINEKITKKKTG